MIYLKTLFRIIFGIIFSFAVFFAAYFSLEISSADAASMAYHAEKHTGLDENKHTRRLTRILGHNPRGRRNAWCGSFVCAMARKAGKKCPSGYKNARRWEGAGRAVSKGRIRRSDVVTFYSKYAASGRHVGIVLSRKGSKIKVSSGNQKNRVNIKWYSVKSVSRARRF